MADAERSGEFLGVFQIVRPRSVPDDVQLDIIEFPHKQRERLDQVRDAILVSAEIPAVCDVTGLIGPWAGFFLESSGFHSHRDTQQFQLFSLPAAQEGLERLRQDQ